MLEGGPEIKKDIPFGLLLAPMVLLLLFVPACGKGASPAELPSSLVPVPSPAAAPLSATPTPTPPVPPSATPVAPGGEKARPVMGVEIRGVEIDGRVIPLENGQRLSLNDGLSLEVFVVPYSPSFEIDIHLFPLRGETPVKGAKVTANPYMPDMGHPSFPATGREVEDGDYGLPLLPDMFGNWEVDIDIRHPEFNTYFRLLLLVYPWRGE